MITTSPVSFGSDRGKTLEANSYKYIDRFLNNLSSSYRPDPGILREDIYTFTRNTDRNHLDSEDKMIAFNLVQRLRLLNELCRARKERDDAEAFQNMQHPLY